MTNYKEMARLHAKNWKVIRTGMSYENRQKLYAEYETNNDEHLCKILTLRNIEL